ncbi:Hypp428 [Branchiostoma lanceolatum]|uniref:Hypp428 protein n=1 Tax=Branchiostoma lanceolatum TaxID=7740 RepID=A0A8J9YNQ0_BRALA|nr:Hypp428 [Branchiostoma lanceolatum]
MKVAVVILGLAVVFLMAWTAHAQNTTAAAVTTQSTTTPSGAETAVGATTLLMGALLFNAAREALGW